MTKNGNNKKNNGNSNGKVLSTQSSVNQTVKSVCDILRRSNCKGAMQYVPELTWILFLRILDEREQREATEAQAFGRTFTPSLSAPYRWHDWAATPEDSLITQRDGKTQGWMRREITEGKQDAFIAWANAELLPYLRNLKQQPNATPRQRVISEVMSGVKQVRVDNDKNFLDVLDKVHLINESAIDTTHLFPLSQVFEGLLLKMGEKGGDGGQFFTPREIIRAMIRVVNPQIGDTVYDAACGTGGFLAQAYEYMLGEDSVNIKSPSDFDTLKYQTFYGREQDDITYTIALANLVLHQIDHPHIWHGNALTNDATYDGLYTNAPERFDVVLMNPPFGGKEGIAAQQLFPFKTGATSILFLQLAMRNLKQNGRCGIVLDEGVLFRTNEQAFVKTKRKLLDENDLYCIISLPGGVFTQAGAGVKTNLLFFTQGKPTEKIWYYDLSSIKVGKKTPLTIDKFDEFFQLLETRGDSEKSWTIDFTAKREKARQEAEPFKQRVKLLESEIYKTRESIKWLKLQSPQNKSAINDLSGEIERFEIQTRENRAKAESIENAIYDIKAVNPNAQDLSDKRTPKELIEFINLKSEEVETALNKLSVIC